MRYLKMVIIKKKRLAITNFLIMKKTIKQVEDFFTLYKTFAWEKDSESMISLYDEQVLIFDMWGEGHCSGLVAWSVIIKDWLGSLEEERVNVTFEMIQIHQGDKVSFATEIVGYQAISVDNKVIRSMKNRITVGFTKTETGWKVVHQHTSAPIDSDLKAILDL
jgi:ketosteroid isomerase-like protein